MANAARRGSSDNDGTADGDGDFPAVDPGTLGATASPGDTGTADQPVNTRKRRSDAGKSRGSRANTTKSAPLDLNGLEGLLLAIHTTLSALTGQTALQLSQEEARAIAAAASNVSRHYDMRTSQKVLDWGALGMVLAGIYGPRAAYLLAMRRDQTAARAPETQAATSIDTMSAAEQAAMAFDNNVAGSA